jgi:hypothetical protein
MVGYPRTAVDVGQTKKLEESDISSGAPADVQPSPTWSRLCPRGGHQGERNPGRTSTELDLRKTRLDRHWLRTESQRDFRTRIHGNLGSSHSELTVTVA